MFLRNLTDKQALRWSLEREIGIWKWILGNGVLGLGCLMFTMMTLTAVLTDGKMTMPRNELLNNAWIFVVGGGLLYGMMIWFINENDFRRYQETKGPPSSPG